MTYLVHKLRVLWVTSSTLWGGSETASLTMMRSLINLGFDCRLCAPSSSYIGLRCQEYGIEHYPIDIPTLKTNPITALRSICRFIQLARVLCEGNTPDVIVGIGERTQIYLSILRLTGTLIPQVWVSHQHWQQFRVIYRFIGWVPRRFIAVSDSLKRFYAIPKMVVIPNPIELPQSLRPLSDRLASRLYDDFIVGIFARFNRLKGIHVLINAVAQLWRDNLHIHLMIFGEQSDLEPEYADELKMKVDGEGLQECVTFRGFTSDVIDDMRQCDVIVSSTLPRFGGPEACSMIIPEAWIAGIPLIGTACGGTIEMIDHGRNGLLVPPDDPIALRKSIHLLIENRELAKRIAEGGRESLPNYESNYIAKRFGEILLECVQKRG